MPHLALIALIACAPTEPADTSAPSDTTHADDTAADTGDTAPEDTAPPDDTGEAPPIDTDTGGDTDWDEVHLTVAGVGFDGSESALYDAERDLYVVSNINGTSSARDGDGFLSRVLPDGTVDALKWIDGASGGFALDAPKGMAILDGVLYVADLSTLRGFDAETGEHVADHALPGGGANDVAAGPDGALYVTDTSGGAVYRVDPSSGDVTALAGGLSSPNGIAADDGGLVVLSYGDGDVFALDWAGAVTDLPDPPTGSLDGVVILDGGDLLISSWGCECLYRMDAAGGSEVVVDGVSSPADIGFDALRGRALVPQLGGDALQVHTLP